VRILLTHSNHLFLDPKQVRKMEPYPPLQTLIAAAVLRDKGFDVALFDSTFDAGFEGAYSRHRPDLVVVCEDNFNFLTKMCLLRNRELAFSIAKASSVPTIVTGSDSSDHVNEYLKAGFDYVILGEVENTLAELATAIAAGDSPNKIPGLHCTHPRKPITNLDELPAPAWDLVDMARYRKAWHQAHGYFRLNMVTSRGCPYRCNWCAKPIYGSTYHFRSPELAAEEMRYVKASFNPDRLWFADDVFALSPAWARQFATEVEKRGAQIPFKMQSRCDLMTRDAVGALRRAGCQEVWMGAESGSQRVLDAMDKDIRVEKIYAARENLRAHGIRACLFLQFGYPGETWADIESTIRMVRELAPDDVGISVSYPLPGTKFYQIVAAEVGQKTNWNDSSDLSMMFRGAFSTELYRALADALHAEVRGGENLEGAWRLVHQLRGAERTQMVTA
jgi:radical SAM superfamily enzyme YgiQ (UPF0313 family)